MVLASARSLLFAPGNDERKLRNAMEAGADAVVADLEDAVPVAEKAAARTLAARLLAETETSALKMIRVNGVDTEFCQDDLVFVAGVDLAAIVVPKASPDALERLADGPPVVAIVETAAGLRNACETASHPRTAALVLGAVDLGLELGLEPRADRHALLFARSKVVVDSAAAGVRPPFDAVYLDVEDADGLEAEARYARSLGFGGKACIHPAQVTVVNRVFAPDEEDVERARRIVAAYDEGVREGRGAVALDGKMVDLPVVEQARRVLAASERSDDER